MSKIANFGEALAALQDGKRVMRTDWPDGQFVFRQVPATIERETIPKMQSLPPAVKEEFARRGGGIRYDNQLAIVNPNNFIFGWSPSGEDLLGHDWYILD